MNTIIYKYEVKPGGFSHEIPGLIQLLTVQTQGSTPQLWALVYPQSTPMIHKFKSYGTGHPMPDDPGNYVGTFQIDWMVFHVFHEGTA